MGERSEMNAVFLQVRLNSSRLPGKALMLLEKIPLVEWCMRRLKAADAQEFVLLTCERDAEQLRSSALRCGFTLFTGSEDDVLNRFASAVLYFKPDMILRATGDNPFVSPFLANETIRLAASARADYAVLKNIPVGSSVEAVAAEALLKAAVRAEDAYEHEHVTPYLYRHPEIFRVVSGEAPSGYRSPLSVTVDTEDDFRRVSAWAANRIPETFSLLELVKSNSAADGEE